MTRRDVGTLETLNAFLAQLCNPCPAPTQKPDTTMNVPVPEGPARKIKRRHVIRTTEDEESLARERTKAYEERRDKAISDVPTFIRFVVERVMAMPDIQITISEGSHLPLRYNITTRWKKDRSIIAKGSIMAETVEKFFEMGANMKEVAVATVGKLTDPARVPEAWKDDKIPF